jgi:copper transport protein
MQPHTLLSWRDVLVQYVGFLSSFGILGAIGFRFGVVRGGVRDASGAVGRAIARAGVIGLLGVALGALSLVTGLAKRAAPKHQTIAQAFHAGGATSIAQLVLLFLLALAFALAWRGARGAWPVAGVAAVALALRGAFAGRVTTMVNPLHVLGASLWIGTLFVLVTCGLGELLRPTVPASEREPAVAEIVHRFSIVALTSAALLGITGLVTAWTHLHALRALWTTPYGYALDAKLFFVGVVAALGAWNWRRVGPSLGSDGGARAIRRTASTELLVAAVVLLLTAILVSLPSPKL